MISEVKLIVKEITEVCDELNKQNIKYNSLKALGIKDNILQRKSDLTDSLQKREKTYAKLFEKVKSLLENLSKSNRKVYIAEEPTSYSIFQTIWDNIRSNDCLGSSIVQVDTVNGDITDSTGERRG